jgi:hypothetical protein
MTDDAKATIRYKETTFTLWTPFSDFVIDCSATGGVFDEFVVGKTLLTASLCAGYQAPAAILAQTVALTA